MVYQRISLAANNTLSDGWGGITEKGNLNLRFLSWAKLKGIDTLAISIG
jgi:hypothetical protein